MEFGKSRKVTRISCNHSYSYSARTEGNQCVIGEASPANLFVAIFCSQARQHFPGMNPVTQVWDQNSAGLVEISL